MIGRRTFGIGALMAAGDKLVRPLNAPPAGNAAPGVQPGATSGVFVGRLVIIFGPASGAPLGVFVYAQGTTPGAGNPPRLSITLASHDPYGNPVDPGVTAADALGHAVSLIGGLIQFSSGALVSDNSSGGLVLATLAGEPVFIPDGPVVLAGQSATPSSTTDAATIFATSAGALSVVDGLDSEPYATQRRSLVVGAGGVSVPNATYVTVASSAVGIRTYRISGVAYIVTSSADTTPAIQFNGPTATGEFTITTARAAVLNSCFNIPPNTSGPGFAEIVTSGQTWMCTFDGVADFSNSGTFELQFAATGGSFTIAQFSYCDLMPV